MVLSTLAHFEENVEFTRGDIQHLVPRAAQLLKELPSVSALFKDEKSDPESALDCLDRSLVHSVLRRALLSDVELEGILTKLRRLYLESKAPLAEEHRGLMASLAAQCFNNNYAWYTSSPELLAVKSLRSQEKHTVQELMTLAMYSPLWKLASEVLELHVENDDPDLAYLLSKQVREPLIELELQSTLPSLGVIGNATSEKVASQYQESPYPRWFSIPKQTTEVLSELLSRWCPNVFCSLSNDILVPGCGTGQHPIHLASTFPESQVTALDLSLSSLAYGKRRARDFSLDNIEFWHGDLLAIGGKEDWIEKFAFVDAVGVIHHLQSPQSGCRALSSTLAPGGVIRIGLYSSIARREAGLEEARIMVEGKSQDLRAARRELLDSPLTRFLDFFTLNGFRDLVFPAQETSYSLPDAVGMLEEGGLRTVGIQVPKMVEHQFLQDFSSSLTDWKAWHSFEEQYPMTFAGMYNLLAVTN